MTVALLIAGYEQSFIERAVEGQHGAVTLPRKITRHFRMQWSGVCFLEASPLPDLFY